MNDYSLSAAFESNVSTVDSTDMEAVIGAKR